ncbi:uncharacterized protein SETTUDRAFT_29418 [Exserohilum turcica Et28A]|uniref:Uncharacterized protein n=1 Tax=Exserohilum turcicum (strain 28A) TaxID=671987 RepID=R0KRZ3_EXST2|nr:uncharacterized protein SETTUDRAFT_29418 [Exserohilum turcica Et28A]EOA90567.1 hypothetical protein SETTUDRAFT_29418 [Exserohilum turcica Et28A]
MEKRIGLQNLDNDILRARDRRLVVAETKGHDFDRDRYELARVGKEQVLKRTNMSMWFRVSDMRDSVALAWCP